MRVLVDLPRNRLRFRLATGEPAGPPRAARATIDVGEGGRLIGVEIEASASLAAGIPAPGEDPFAPRFDAGAGSLYFPVSEPPAGGLARSAEAEVALALAADGRLLALDLPRRGHGYEIAWPSGNQ